jgi:hypothetical protein
MKIDDGGPAFPSGESYTKTDLMGNSYHNTRWPLHKGMTLREYIAIHCDQPGRLEIASAAGQTLREFCGLSYDDPGRLAFPTWDEWFHQLPQSERFRLYAKVRYAIADAMLAFEAEQEKSK